MNTAVHLLRAFCLCFLLTPAFSQNILINYEKSDSLFVCGADTFFIKIQNTGTTLAGNASLKLTLPVGVDYLPGSISGAGEQNITDLHKPVFTLADLPAGAVAEVALLVHAGCEAAATLDTGQLFIADIEVESSAGNAQVSTTSFAVETGLLLIDSIGGALLSGEKGDTLLRTICVKNTRLGKIGSLYFEDAHLNGFNVFVPNAAAQTNGATLFQADFSGSFFSTAGDGDSWLENGEKVCFTERIILTDCGIPAFSNPSGLRVGWGCGGEICRFDSALVAIEIKESTRIPNLIFSPVWSPPTDYCGNTPAAATGLKIVNTGSADAKNIIVRTSVIDDMLGYGIGVNSIRMVHNGQTTVINPDLSTPGQLPYCGLDVSMSVSGTIPEIKSGDSILYLFDTYTCKPSCDQVLPFFGVEYFYKKPCPINGFVSDTLFITPDPAYIVGSFTGSQIGSCLQSGQSYSFDYTVITKRLIEDDGFLHLRLTMPLGLSPDDSCQTLLGGIAPILSESTPADSGGYDLHLVWKLPLPDDTLNMSFCLRYDCNENMKCIDDFPTPPGTVVIYSADCITSCFLQLDSKTYWTPELNTPYECAIGDCDSIRIAVSYSCFTTDPGENTDTIGTVDFIFPLPGFKKWFNVYRANYGFEDLDDNRHADGPNRASPADVRTDRFLPGDTLRVEYCGTVDSGGSLVKFGRTIWHEIVSSDIFNTPGLDFYNTNSAQNEFVNNNVFYFLQDSIRIRYADGSEAGCRMNDLVFYDDRNYFYINQINNWPPQVVDELASMKYRFQFSLEDLHASGCLPKGTLDLGDSIFVYTDFRVDMNYRPNSSNLPNPPLVGFRTALSDGGPLYAYNAQPFKKLEYSGFITSKSPNTFSIKACEPSAEVKKFRYNLRIARKNMFPREVRPISRIIQYDQSVPPGLQALSAKLEYLVLQDSVPFLSNLPLPFVQGPDFLSLDFNPAFTEPVDEGYTLRTNLVFQPDCYYDRPDSSWQYFWVKYYNPVKIGANPVPDSIVNGIGFFSNTPGLSLETADSIVTSPTTAFDIDFTLLNSTIPQAFNTWVYVVSKSGLSGDLKLFQSPQNQPVSQQNGVFATGTVNGLNQRSFKLTGIDQSCETDTLFLIFGWNCTPLATPDQAACGRDTVLIELRVQKPELELEILGEPPSIPLCDTSGYFEFEIYNAKSGSAFDPFATVKLPQGLSIVASSVQVSYPAGSAFTQAPDPQVLPGNLQQWSLADLSVPVLPGIGLDPQNALRIRFKTIAECGFVANTQLIYGTRGKEPCGRSTNILNKPGKPLIVSGSNPVYGVSVVLEPTSNETLFCGATRQFSVKLTLLGSPSAGDSIYLLLPSGISYLPGSYLPQQNAPAGPPTADGSNLRLALPANLGLGSTVLFLFSVTIGEAAGCIDQSIVAQTRVRTELFCETLGAPCTVYASTGEDIATIHIQHPELELMGADASISGNGIDMNIAVHNIGTVPAAGVHAQIWYDADGSGSITAGDSLLQSVSDNQLFGSGSSITLHTLLPDIDPGLLCNLLIRLPAAENCACSDKLLPLTNINLQHTLLEVCEIQPSAVGVPAQQGFTYQWSGATGIVCPNCATTTFVPPANAQPGQLFLLTLEEQSAGCTVTHRFELTFGTLSGISIDLSSGCKGTPVHLAASPAGVSYHWSGPGIIDPALQNQTVTPDSGGIYSVVVIFPNGCRDTLEKPFTVFQPDTVHLPELTTCEGKPVPVAGIVTTDVPGIYSNLLQTVHGCDSVIYQVLNTLPNPKKNESISFCAGDTLFVFDTLLTQSGQVCRTFTAANGCDSVHCVQATVVPLPQVSGQDTIFALPGQPVSLDGPGGFDNYVWFPADSTCLNCPHITVLPDSNGYFEYKLVVTDTEGCEGEVIFRVFVFPPCDPQRLLIPNAFTPNDDGVNDVFRVVPYEGAEIIGSLIIYDRWGEKVYEGSGNASWDGTVDGQPGPSDVYAYLINILCDGKSEWVWGDIALLR